MSDNFPWQIDAEQRDARYRRGRALLDAVGRFDPNNDYQLGELNEMLPHAEDLEAYLFAYEEDYGRPSTEATPTPGRIVQRPDANQIAPAGTDGELFEILKAYEITRSKSVDTGTVMSDVAKCRLMIRYLEQDLARSPRASDLTPIALRGYCEFLERAQRKLPTDRPLSSKEVNSTSPQPMSAKTKFSHAMAVAAFLEWLPQQMYAVDVGVAGIVRTKFPKPKGVKIASSSFEDDELQRFFGAPEYRDGTFKHSGDYWAPLLAAYTGGCQGELLQLECADVREVDGCVVIAIRDDGEGQKLKTDNRPREVPLHPHLIALGFLDFVRWRRDSGLTRLFPDEERTRKGYFGAYSKRFNRQREALGISSDRSRRKRDFHSFRHAFNKKLKHAGVPLYHIKALMGHSLDGDGMSFSVYGQEPLSVASLAKYVAKIDYTIAIDEIRPNGFREWQGRAVP